MLCMSTSHHKDHSGPGCAVGLGVLLSLLFAASTAQADALPKQVPSSGKLVPALRSQLGVALVKQLEQDEQLPGHGPVVSGQDRSMRASSGGRRIWLTPVQVRYKSLSNSYCRLAVSDEGMENTRLVPLPPTELNDSCIKVSSQFVVDANGTGATDVVQSVRIRSNRGTYEVSEALVYLAHPQSASGYCFSSQASRELTPESLRTAQAINAALKDSRARLGLQEYSCDG